MSRKPPGNPSKLSTAQRAELVRIVGRGPIPAVDGVVRWRLIDLAAWMWDEFGISVRRRRSNEEHCYAVDLVVIATVWKHKEFWGEPSRAIDSSKRDPTSPAAGSSEDALFSEV